MLFSGVGKYIQTVGIFKVFDEKYNYSWLWLTAMRYYANKHISKLKDFIILCFNFKAMDKRFLNSKFKHAMAVFNFSRNSKHANAFHKADEALTTIIFQNKFYKYSTCKETILWISMFKGARVPEDWGHAKRQWDAHQDQSLATFQTTHLVKGSITKWVCFQVQ